jgi:hypothetical protein
MLRSSGTLRESSVVGPSRSLLLNFIECALFQRHDVDKVRVVSANHACIVFYHFLCKSYFSVSEDTTHPTFSFFLERRQLKDECL